MALIKSFEFKTDGKSTYYIYKVKVPFLYCDGLIRLGVWRPTLESKWLYYINATGGPKTGFDTPEQAAEELIIQLQQMIQVLSQIKVSHILGKEQNVHG